MGKINELTRGCVVFMKASSGLIGYGNGQCVSDVCEPLGTISLFGHNQNYSISDIERIAEYSLQSQLVKANAEIERLRGVIHEFQNKMLTARNQHEIDIERAEAGSKRLREDALPNPLQIELGAGKVLVSKFEDTDGAAGVMFACGQGQFPIGTPFGNLEGRHTPQKGEVYIRCTNLASLKILKQCIVEAEQALKGD